MNQWLNFIIGGLLLWSNGSSVIRSYVRQEWNWMMVNLIGLFFACLILYDWWRYDGKGKL